MAKKKKGRSQVLPECERRFKVAEARQEKAETQALANTKSLARLELHAEQAIKRDDSLKKTLEALHEHFNQTVVQDAVVEERFNVMGVLVKGAWGVGLLVIGAIIRGFVVL